MKKEAKKATRTYKRRKVKARRVQRRAKAPEQLNLAQINSGLKFLSAQLSSALTGQ